VCVCVSVSVSVCVCVCVFCVCVQGWRAEWVLKRCIIYLSCAALRKINIESGRDFGVIRDESGDVEKNMRNDAILERKGKAKASCEEKENESRHREENGRGKEMRLNGGKERN